MDVKLSNNLCNGTLVGTVTLHEKIPMPDSQRYSMIKYMNAKSMLTILKTDYFKL